MEVLNILPKRLYKFSYDGKSEPLMLLLDSLKKDLVSQLNIEHKTDGILHGNELGLPSGLMDMDVGHFKRNHEEIYDFMMDSLTQVINHEQFIDKEFFMSQIWGTVYHTSGQAHGKHIHPNSVFSSIFNVDAMPPNNTTNFHSSIGGLFGEGELQNIYTHKEAKEASDLADDIEISHKPGDYLVFRSNLAHSVPHFDIQRLGETRIVMSANYWMRKMGSKMRATYLNIDDIEKE